MLPGFWLDLTLLGLFFPQAIASAMPFSPERRLAKRSITQNSKLWRHIAGLHANTALQIFQKMLIYSYVNLAPLEICALSKHAIYNFEIVSILDPELTFYR